MLGSAYFLGAFHFTLHNTVLQNFSFECPTAVQANLSKSLQTHWELRWAEPPAAECRCRLTTARGSQLSFASKFSRRQNDINIAADCDYRAFCGVLTPHGELTSRRSNNCSCLCLSYIYIYLYVYTLYTAVYMYVYLYCMCQRKWCEAQFNICFQCNIFNILWLGTIHARNRLAVSLVTRDRENIVARVRFFNWFVQRSLGQSLDFWK